MNRAYWWLGPSVCQRCRRVTDPILGRAGKEDHSLRPPTNALNSDELKGLAMNHRLQIINLYEYLCTVADGMSHDGDCLEFDDIETITQAAEVLYQGMSKTKRDLVNPPKKSKK